ncbi:hypothetical protein MPTK1_3g19820 [Marchantia polymorpha subsp. ruderalis]|uniref:Uncharacterized protein n=2 Tax=Marchantia polymorpha TaxID=3197 RepID=A0AAF6B2P8_MARPO|nr:hypothetical protein MARPO_0049s0052 [Marchantia polymorpha]BBN06282.1 hypothetical protein Mp_3g19820 [Marchantia polymorpha subsp. ruderalis]|eukprot:PTQ38761.1 hypothetical protein MARPO_0049s0052 [Marchantia polymorpha]
MLSSTNSGANASKILTHARCHTQDHFRQTPSSLVIENREGTDSSRCSYRRPSIPLNSSRQQTAPLSLVVDSSGPRD